MSFLEVKNLNISYLTRKEHIVASKNVRKANESVKTKIVIIKKFLFNKANII